MARNAKNTRMCLGCMTRKDKNDMICINKSPQGNISFCISEFKKDGRCAYLCKDVKCLEKSLKKKSFSAKLRCSVDAGFYDDLREFFKSVGLE